MIYIDKYAYISKLKNIRPEFKLSFGVIALISAISSKSIYAYLFVFMLMAYLSIYKGKIPILYYMKLFVLPFGFLFLSVIGIIIEINFTTFSINLKENGWILAILLICKALSSVSCLYFIILSTPIRDIVNILNLLKLPNVIISLITLTYRFIFILLEISSTKLKSQQCRMAYRKRTGFAKSFGMLWGSVFVQSMEHGEWIYKAMEVRGYNGEIKFLPKKIFLEKKDIIYLISFIIIIFLLNYI